MKKQASQEVQLIKVDRAHLGLHFAATQATACGVCQPRITSSDTLPCPGTRWKPSNRGSRSLKMIILEFVLVATISSSSLCLTFLRRPHRELLIQQQTITNNLFIDRERLRRELLIQLQTEDTNVLFIGKWCNRSAPRQPASAGSKEGSTRTSSRLGLWNGR